MERQIFENHGVPVVFRGGGGETSELPFERIELFVTGTLEEAADRNRFERRANCKELGGIGRGQRRDSRPTTRGRNDEPFGFEQAQRVAHGPAGNLQFIGQQMLDQPFAVLEASRKDPLS